MIAIVNINVFDNVLTNLFVNIIVINAFHSFRYVEYYPKIYVYDLCSVSIYYLTRICYVFTNNVFDRLLDVMYL